MDKTANTKRGTTTTTITKLETTARTKIRDYHHRPHTEEYNKFAKKIRKFIRPELPS